MRVSAISYLVLSVVVFAVFFGVQALIVPYFLPAPTIEELSHPLEVTGTYTYFDGGKSSQRAVRVGNMKFYCGASAVDGFTCLGYMHGLAQRTSITVKFVNLKSLFGHVALAMNIRSSSGSEIFNQTPVQGIKVWKSGNLYWCSISSLILTIMAVGAFQSYVQSYLTRNI